MAGYIITHVNEHGFRVHLRYYATDAERANWRLRRARMRTLANRHHATTEHHPDVDAAYAAIGEGCLRIVEG